MLYKPLHCRHYKSHQCSGGVLGVRYWLLSKHSRALKNPAWIPVRCTPPLLHAYFPVWIIVLFFAGSDLQAKHASVDWWLGKTRPDSTATGNNAGHRLGPCLLLYLERGCLDREGKMSIQDTLCSAGSAHQHWHHIISHFDCCQHCPVFK